MDEDHDQFFEPLYPLGKQMQERVDQILLAVAGRLWEVRRDMTPAGQQTRQESWQPEAMRRSPLGQQLMLIARYVERWDYSITPAQVERAMQRVLRTIFGNPFNESYSMPARFHTTELGKLFRQLPLAKAQGLVPHSARVETIGWLTEQPASKDVSMLAR
jgi:hypothetical protein